MKLMHYNCIPTVAHSLICMCSEGIGCGENHMHQNFTCNTTGKCYKKIEWFNGHETISYGCIPTKIQSHFSCRTDFSLHVKTRHGVLCCNSKDFCNSGLKPTIPPTTEPMSGTFSMSVFFQCQVLFPCLFFSPCSCPCFCTCLTYFFSRSDRCKSIFNEYLKNSKVWFMTLFYIY